MTTKLKDTLFQIQRGYDHGRLPVGWEREIAFRLTGAGEPDVLEICFHGAIDRKKIALPRFQAAMDAGPRAACVSICDPMRHFVSGPLAEEFDAGGPSIEDDLELICDEEKLDQSAETGAFSPRAPSMAPVGLTAPYVESDGKSSI